MFAHYRSDKSMSRQTLRAWASASSDNLTTVQFAMERNAKVLFHVYVFWFPVQSTSEMSCDMTGVRQTKRGGPRSFWAYVQGLSLWAFHPK